MMSEITAPQENFEEPFSGTGRLKDEKLDSIRFVLIARQDITQLHLNSTDGFVLSRIEHHTDFNSLKNMTGLPRETLLESISKLICYGLLTTEDDESDRLLMQQRPVTQFSCLRAEVPSNENGTTVNGQFEMAAPADDEEEKTAVKPVVKPEVRQTAVAGEPPPVLGPVWTDPPPVGSLRNVSFPEIVDFIMTSEQSGVLTVESPKASKQVYFKRGKLLFVESISIEEELCLGQILLNFGKISRQDLEVSRQRMAEQGKKQGEVLIEMQAISPQLLAGGLKKQIELKFTDIYGLKDGVYKFKRRTDFDYHDFDFSLAALNFKGAAEKTPPEKIRQAMTQHFTSALKVKATPSRFGKDRIKLNAGEREFLQKLEKADTVSRSYVYSPYNREKTQALLYAFNLAGFVDFVKSDDLEQRRSTMIAKFKQEKDYLKTENYFEMLEIHWTSPFDEITRAHKLLIDKYTVSPSSEMASDELLELSQQITEKIDRAYRFLSDDVVRKNYRKKILSAHDIANGAEIQFRKGENFLYWQEEYDQAVFHLESALELQPDNPTYMATLALALFSQSRITYHDENHRSIKLLKQAQSLDDQNPVVYFCHGMIYKRIGKTSEASRMFTTAIKLDPKYSDARKALDSI